MKLSLSYKVSNIIISYMSCLFLVIFMPSCVQYHKLVKSEFPQGEERKDKREVAYNYLRTEKIYDQFCTQAIFHVLWLSDEVRTSYIDDFSQRRGKNKDAKEALLKRQLEENRHWVVFYVLADVRLRQDVSLSDKNPYWTLFIETACGKKVEPISIKEVDIEPEYQAMFGHRYNPYKSVYLVKFPARSIDGAWYVRKQENSKQVESLFNLVISSPYKLVRFEWDEKNKKKHTELLKDEDFYWG